MRKLLAAFVLVVLVACDAPPTGVQGNLDETVTPPAPSFAAADASPVFFPFAFPVVNCAEVVDISGQFHPVIKGFVNANGNFHGMFHINAKGTGVGQTTGATYEWNDRLFDLTNIAPGGAQTFILNDNTRLIGHGQAVNQQFHIQIKVTINANGDVTVDTVDIDASCG